MRPVIRPHFFCQWNHDADLNRLGTIDGSDPKEGICSAFSVLLPISSGEANTGGSGRACARLGGGSSSPLHYEAPICSHDTPLPHRTLTRGSCGEASCASFAGARFTLSTPWVLLHLQSSCRLCSPRWRRHQVYVEAHDRAGV